MERKGPSILQSPVPCTGHLHSLMSPMIINWMTSTMTQNYKLSADMLVASLGAEHNTKTTSSAGGAEASI